MKVKYDKILWGIREDDSQWSVADIKITAMSTAPTGWMICDGAAISRTTYSALFSAISTTYGAGDGTTTFNIPNFKGRVPVGFDSTQTEFNVLGEVGWAKTHTLTTTEMPSHSHTVQGYVRTDYDINDVFSNYQGLDTGSGAYGTSSVGWGAAHNNIQPYITINYLIKY